MKSLSKRCCQYCKADIYGGDACGSCARFYKLDATPESLWNRQNAFNEQTTVLLAELTDQVGQLHDVIVQQTYLIKDLEEKILLLESGR